MYVYLNVNVYACGYMTALGVQWFLVKLSVNVMGRILKA